MTKGQADAILGELKQIRLLLQTRQNAGAPASPPSPPQASEPVDIRIAADVHALGRLNAPVTMIEFTDYQCPFCRQFHRETFQALKKEFIDTGELRYVSRDLPLPMHKHALKAAEAARCAGDQGEVLGDAGCVNFQRDRPY
jgi:protein-disulfide isomerase